MLCLNAFPMLDGMTFEVMIARILVCSGSVQMACSTSVVGASTMLVFTKVVIALPMR
jgi:hypothetical protein